MNPMRFLIGREELLPSDSASAVLTATFMRDPVHVILANDLPDLLSQERERCIEVMHTHRITGYYCSCGDEVNSWDGHWASVMRREAL